MIKSNEHAPIQFKMRGLIMAGGNGTRLSPLTKTINKHLLPVFDKPMIYYPLTTLMLAGIREIAIVIRSRDLASFKEILGNGNQLGMQIEYLVQEEALGIPDGIALASNFIGPNPVCLMLGDNVLIGQGLGRTLSRFTEIAGAQVFAFPVSNPSEYGVVELSNDTGKAIRIEEKPKSPRSNLAIPGLYFFDNSVIQRVKKLKLSSRGEYEITDLLNSYLTDDVLKIEILERGTGWMDAGTTQSLYGAGELVRVLQERQGLRIGVPEEVAFRNSWIDKAELTNILDAMPQNDYKDYLQKLLGENSCSPQ